MATAERTSAGFSLLETLVALALSVFLLAGLFQFVAGAQRVTVLLLEVLQREQVLATAPVLLNTLLAGGGNRRPPGTDPVRVTTSPAGVEAEADLDGPEGFPDGDLDEPYEQIALRSGSGALRLRGASGGFQPLLPAVELDAAELAAPNLLVLNLGTARPGWPGAMEAEPESLQVRFYLWNLRRRLFEETP